MTASETWLTPGSSGGASGGGNPYLTVVSASAGVGTHDIVVTYQLDLYNSVTLSLSMKLYLCEVIPPENLSTINYNIGDSALTWTLD